MIAAPLHRRQLLQLGGASLFGLSAAQASNRPTAKACIVLFLSGGPPGHETVDPKPDAPEEIRGPSKAIATATPGIFFGEWLPQLAKRSGDLAILRSMITRDNAHSSSGYWMLTGRPHTPTNVENAKPGAPNDAPSLAAMMRAVRPDPGLPGSMILPEDIHNNPNLPWPGQFAGWLGRAADPWLLHCDPAQNHFEIPALGLPEEVSLERLAGRNSLLEQLNRSAETSPRWQQHDIWRQQALKLASSANARRAFNLSLESPALRDRYGRGKWGQTCLLARRLVEAGVHFVQVNWPREPNDSNAGSPLWDTHQQNAERLKKVLLPQFDQGLSALMDDLKDRGLFDSTLVVAMGEFGRTPKINPAAGRDHWGFSFSSILMGAGVRGGQVIGSTDRHGAMVQDLPIQPQDLQASILDLLDVDLHRELKDTQGRVIPISTGRVIEAIRRG